MATCYRHPSRETGVSCSNCGNPICPDCMTATPVGMRCPECARQKTQVRTVASIHGGDPMATYVIMGICVLVAFGTGGLLGGSNRVFYDGALAGLSVNPFTGQLVGIAEGEYWRLITSGFLHGGIIHLAFNMYVLYFLGSMLEPSLGRARFLALYFTSLLGGSFGALLFQPNGFTVGASGAVFGLMGAAFLMQRARGIDPMRSGIGPLILLNLFISFIPGLNISIGGHLGGLAAGLLAAFLIEEVAKRRASQLIAVAGCAVVGALAVAGALILSGNERATAAVGALASLVS